MTAGSEVVEDYGHVGLTLRSHPVCFLRGDLRRQRIVTCAEAMQARDGRWLETAGLVLVRQMPGSAKGVVFITIEDETGIANLVIWPKLYERQRRVILSAGMMAVHGRIQREGEVVHLVAHRVSDLSNALASVGHRDTTFPLPHGRGDQLRHGSPGLDPREPAAKRPGRARHPHSRSPHRHNQAKDTGFPMKCGPPSEDMRSHLGWGIRAGSRMRAFMLSSNSASLYRPEIPNLDPDIKLAR